MYYRAQIDERTIHKHTVDFEYEGTAEELDKILDEIEKRVDHRDDICSVLTELGVTVIDFTEDDFGDCDEFEVSDLEEIM